MAEPADGDDYTYLPRQLHAPPLIPAQYVGPGDFRALLAEFRRLLQRVADLDARIVELERLNENSARRHELSERGHFELRDRVDALERQAQDWTGD